LRRRNSSGQKSRRDSRRHHGRSRNQGRDKLTIITSPGIYDLGAWLEQLLAESTGKIGKGIIPVDREKLAKPASYANDRVFAYLRLASKPNKAQDAAVAALEKAGHPSYESRCPTSKPSARNFSDGKLLPPSPAPSSASTLSISPTSKPARSKRANSLLNTKPRDTSPLNRRLRNSWRKTLR